MEDLKVTIVQSSLHWENVDANIAAFAGKLSKVPAGETDLIVLPEMFTTGFTMNAEGVAEQENGKALSWMKSVAKEKSAVITGSVVIKDDNGFYNRMFWVRPDGTYETYNKRHLFRMANEHHTYVVGDKKWIVELKGWRFRPLICYDLRFPVWSRNRNDYDCLIYVANWPESRNFPWKQLLIARAIENQSYVIGVNRVGTDGHNQTYSGDSAVLGPKGEQLSKTQAHEEAVETVMLSAKWLKEFREIFPAHLDADAFEIK